VPIFLLLSKHYRIKRAESVAHATIILRSIREPSDEPDTVPAAPAQKLFERFLSRRIPADVNASIRANPRETAEYA
jgi:hypothetical protein